MDAKVKTELTSRIIELEYEITVAIIEGHKPFYGDEFQSKRDELNTLRCIVFGYSSQYCKKKFINQKI